MSWLSHRELRIVCGVAPVPGDTLTVESPPIVVDLISPTSGIVLDPINGWSPNIPSIESGGVWADTPLSPGRLLLVAEEGNVTETMHVVISGSSPLAMMKTLNSLYAMAENARNFWTDNAQIQPVYLHWQPAGGVNWIGGRQYSLIFNMDIKPEFADSETPQVNATITIEREPFWSWLPSGASPKQWYYEWINQAWNATKTDLTTGTDHLVTGTFSNFSEFTDNTATALRSDNSITIPAASIPGDVNAKLFLWLGTSAGRSVIIGKRTTKVTTYSTSVGNAVVAQNLINNAADGSLGTNATLAADTGASLDMTNTRRRVEVSFATATDQPRLTFPGVNNLIAFNRLVGRYNVFLRCRQSSGSAGDVSMYIRYGYVLTGAADGIKLNTVNPPVPAGGTGNTPAWSLVYMGVASFPIEEKKAFVNSGQSTTIARGLSPDSSSGIQFVLNASRSTGAGLLYINDLVLIPIDEGSMTIIPADTTTRGNLQYDNTGYYTHGLPADTVSNAAQLGIASANLAYMTGPGIQLTPNVENKLYFLTYDSSNLSIVAGESVSVILNIIPRSRGLRDRTNLAG